MNCWIKLLSSDTTKQVSDVIICTSRFGNIIAVNTVLSYVFYNDDGYCQSLHNQSDCLTRTSFLESDANVCIWAENEHYCYPVEFPITLQNMTLILLSIAIMSYPLNKICIILANAYDKALVVSNQLLHDAEAKETEPEKKKREENWFKNLKVLTNCYSKFDKLPRPENEFTNENSPKNLSGKSIEGGDQNFNHEDLTYWQTFRSRIFLGKDIFFLNFIGMIRF